MIWSMLHTLTKREESVLSKYFGLYGEGLTIEELGQEYHLTRDYIRRIKNKGVRKVFHRVINIDWVVNPSSLQTLIKICWKNVSKNRSQRI